MHCGLVSGYALPCVLVVVDSSYNGEVLPNYLTAAPSPWPRL